MMGVLHRTHLHTERITQMNASTITKAAVDLIPRLEMYYRAARQAEWQYRAAAGEYKPHWMAVRAQIQTKIEVEELKVAEALGIASYRGKRVFTK